MYRINDALLAWQAQAAAPAPPAAEAAIERRRLDGEPAARPLKIDIS